MAVAPGEVAADHPGLLLVCGVVGAVEGEVAQRLNWASMRLSQLQLVGVWASSTLFAAAQSPTRVSTLVDRCGLKLSSTIAIRTCGGCSERR